MQTSSSHIEQVLCLRVQTQSLVQDADTEHIFEDPSTPQMDLSHLT